jgi:hypothetical protein
LEILEDETVSIIHHSLTEYLTNPQKVGEYRPFTSIYGLALCRNGFESFSGPLRDRECLNFKSIVTDLKHT